LFICVATLFGQTSPPAPYVPGVTYQNGNPNYPLPNPFFFEGRIDWNLLKITTPSNAWEFAERGIHKQDDLADIPGAIADYQQSVALNNTGNASCQIVTAPLPTSGTLSPPPCMFTMRLRLAGLLRESAPQDAIALYQDVLKIDALRLGVHAAMAETYSGMAAAETDPAKAATDYNQAISEFQAELALSPVTELTTSVTGDLANNAHVHWELAEIYQHLDDSAHEATELDLYLKATQWHSDTYPWRIDLAKARLAAMGGAPLVKPRTPPRPRSPESEKRKSE
jgi:tetratricopeptide (TPR) repeat protein